MRFDYFNNKSLLDSSVLDDMKKIDKQISEEKNSENPNQAAIVKLRMDKLYRGMSLCGGYAVNKYQTAGVPW